MRRAIFGAFLLVAVGGCTNELKGSVSAELKPTQQSWTSTPAECASGQRQGFFGVDMRPADQDDHLVRAVLDPVQGTTLLLNIPGTDRSVTVQPNPACAAFDVVVERQSSTINNITNVRGHIRVDCDLPEMKVRADIEFANCH